MSMDAIQRLSECTRKLLDVGAKNDHLQAHVTELKAYIAKLELKTSMALADKSTLRTRVAELEHRIEDRIELAKAEQARIAELEEALRDMLLWADTPSQEASPSWIIGACHRARIALLPTEEGQG